MLILLSKQPERKIAIVSESYALVIKCVSSKKSESKPLCSIELTPKKQLANQGYKKLSNYKIEGFIGLVEINGLIFIGTITSKSKVAQPIPKQTVNKILGIEFFCLNDSLWDFVEIDSSGYPAINEDPSAGGSITGGNMPGSDFHETFPRHPCFEIRKLLSNGSFYYSSDFDLTSTLQNRGYSDHTLSSDNFEEEYMWNSFLMQEVVTYRNRLDENDRQILDEEGFLTTIIRGFAETFVTYVRQLKIAVTIISKQSWKRAGTRFNARGVDDDSNVANFVETEFIMFSSQYCYAFTQIRGSIPVFWEQDTSLLNPKVQITRSVEATQPVFDKHFTKLNDKYGTINVVNLLSTKSSEIELSQRYKKHLQQSEKFQLGIDVFLTEFDFHRETSQEGFSGVKKILPLVMDAILNYGYFSYDVKEKKIISEQQGIFRTNCLDCLDRTNLVQQTISLAAFKLFLEDFQLIKPNAYVDDDNFVSQHNTLWADHGDQVSQIYTGTNALKSSFSRKGKMSIAGALSDATKSVSRMYINNFMDKGKQQNIDALLGRLPHQKPVQLYDPVNEYITAQLDTLKDKFISYSSANILVGTLNANGISRNADLSKWLFPIGDKFIPDMVVLGLQEVIELTAGSILNADYSKSSFWQQLVSECLSQYGEKYMLLRVEQMSSLMILFFVKADKAKYIKQVEGSSKKTGFGGMTGNKGAVAIRFDYGGTSFCFVNAHFSAGANNVEERRSDFESIIKSIIFSRSKTVPHHDSIFWLGDLNYRISLANEEVRRELAAQREGYIDRLLKYDQLTQEINAGVVFKGFKEPSLKFRPTYKYDLGTDIYDTSEKARTPSWTDRIVYRGSNLHPLAYSDAHLLISDHRPVYAAYRAQVMNINEAVKLDLQKKLYKDYKEAHPDLPDVQVGNLIDIERRRRESLSPPTGVTLLDLDSPSTIKPHQENSSSDLSSAFSSPSSNSLSNIPLKARKNSPSVVETNNRHRLPPPPPPASRNGAAISSPPQPTSRGASTSILQNADLSKSSSLSSFSSFASVNDSNTVKKTLNDDDDALTMKDVHNAPAPPKARKPLPPGFSDTILQPKNSSDNSRASVSKTTPSPPPSRLKSPPSLTSGVTPSKIEPLKPKNKSVTPPPVKPKPEGFEKEKIDPVTPKQTGRGNLPPPPPPSHSKRAESATSTPERETHENETSTTTPAAPKDKPHKVPPAVPAKKAGIEHLGMDSWKPLTPK
ncbi:hypothetical protein TBLA_0C05610 [Henningerozyma blattae CBS 6284]|uniref:phosphoinositide 5-phosphatase n=1 Tax=Henningerozyma blattae (strain ATCC 34711 / CBS 6284 / DSM 70876 / NBRC 10599 / NRRL Y-10934 / UCD 77-7) TaxID=1071380 RepID=I2H1V7_HENB6|nr:hypothetical protein TBLA_0C05610 [Tetrapisispora blattae CBS 6284]CCH60359.1 hypothetical protein TBLA_0C05610 [Tetrapisispora blattae CBS 6284]